MNLRTVVPMLVVLAFCAAEASAQEVGKAELGLRGWSGTNSSQVRKGLSPTTSNRLNFEDDLDAGDTSGAGFQLTFNTVDGHQLFVSGWNLTGSGRDIVAEDYTFGSLTFLNGSQVTADFELRSMSVGFIYAATPVEDAFFFGAGLAFNWLTANAQLSQGGAAESLDYSALHYPTANIETGVRFGKYLELGVDVAAGLPSYSKAHGDDIRTPLEVRGALRIPINRLHLEFGYQIFRASILNDQNQPEETRANIRLEGMYFEVGFRF